MNQTEFNLEEGLKRKAAGMERAALNRATALHQARRAARIMAETWGTVTADDVYRVLREWETRELGNAAGSIFRGKEWEFTGQWVQSKRPSNHGRMIRIWSLKR